jgi:hypothetical protein
MERLSGPQQAEGDAGGASVIRRMLVDVSTWVVRMAEFVIRRRSFGRASFCEFTGVHFHGPNQ